MNRLTVGITFIGIAASVVSYEIYSHPEIFERATPDSASAAIISTVSDTIPQLADIAAPTPGIPVPNTYFNVAALKEAGIELKDGKFSMVLFRHAQILPAQDPFFLVSFSAVRNGTPFLQIAEILPTEEMSAGRLLSLVRRKLRTSILNEDASLITLSESLSTRGEANFYLNDDKSFGDQVFLVTRSGTKVLAMQFPDAYNEQVAELLPLFFKD